MSHKGPPLREDEEFLGEDSKREQWHQKPPGAVGAILLSTYKSLGTEPMTHIKGAGYIQQPLQSHIL